MRSDNCPFCRRISAGEYDATEDPRVVSFEPLNPITEGHRLFLPVKHAPDFRTFPGLLALCMEQAARWTVNADENLIVSSGHNATQTVMHFHVHLVPRRAEDGLKLPWTDQLVA